MRYTPWVVSEHVPDYSSLEMFLGHERFQGKADEDLAIALWALMVDHDLGIFHYCPAQERFWGKDAVDPIKILNVFGFTICHCHAHILVMLFRAAGFRSRIANIRGHEGSEVFYNDAWHYFDADIQYFHRKHPPEENVIASREDIFRDPSLIDAQQNPSFPYGFPDRLPENMRPLYEVEPSYLPVFEERIHTMDFRLRPGEEMVRWFHHRGRWFVFDQYPEMFRRYRAETGPEGPTERFWPRRQWANGVLNYQPDLTNASRDIEVGAESMKGLKQDAKGLKCAGERGVLEFAFESPYIYCGIPDPLRRLPAQEGAKLKALFRLPKGTSAEVHVRPERAKKKRVWASKGQSGDITAEIDYTDLVEGTFRFGLSVILKGKGARLDLFANQLWFMVSPHSLPALRDKGENQMSVHHGDKFGLPTRTLLIEHKMEGPGDKPPGAFSTANLLYKPNTYARLLPKKSAKPWELVYELKAPKSGKMAWAAVYAIIEGTRPGEDYDGTHAFIEAAEKPEGPWEVVAESEIYEHPQGWHFGLSGERRFSGKRGKAYIRLRAKKGLLGLRIAAHYVPKGAQLAAVEPLEIEHAWYEVDPRVGRRLRTHTETVEGTEYEYAVRCAEEPHDEYVTLRMLSVLR